MVLPRSDRICGRSVFVVMQRRGTMQATCSVRERNTQKFECPYCDFQLRNPGRPSNCRPADGHNRVNGVNRVVGSDICAVLDLSRLSLHREM